MRSSYCAVDILDLRYFASGGRPLASANKIKNAITSMEIRITTGQRCFGYQYELTDDAVGHKKQKILSEYCSIAKRL